VGVVEFFFFFFFFFLASKLTRCDPSARQKIPPPRPPPHTPTLQDEIFHATQTGHYCRGEFDEWDSAITTFPGSYLLYALVARVIALLTHTPIGTSCGLAELRAQSALLAALVVLACAWLAAASRAATFRAPVAGGTAVVAAMAAFAPLHWFTGLLVYTDAPATLAAVACVAAASGVDADTHGWKLQRY
jgi:hypothetical protein